MSKILQVIGKLRDRSAEELRVRAAQKLHVMAERGGWSSLTRVPADLELFKLLDPTQLESSAVSAEVLLQHFRSRKTPRFFAGFHEKQATIAELQTRFSSVRAIESARRISEGRFDLLGFHDLSFGEPVNWHLEPVSGVVAPTKHWSQISYLDAAQAGDKKITWELNRHLYFATLGRAYWHTQDELYAQTFVAHINSWIDANPPKQGINWASSLEIAFRAISWLWALHFFKDSKQLTPSVFLRILKLLYLHGRHLETYLSTYFSPNTHLTGEALGLFYLGTMLPEFRYAARWREQGYQILMARLERHVRSDGVYFEQSSYYHRYTTDFYTHLLILLQENKATVEAHLEEKLQSLLDHLMYITRPDGTTPLYGDDDGGQLVRLEQRAPDDFRSSLSNGAALFKRFDYKHVAGAASEETLWLLGRKGLQTFDSLVAKAPAHQSCAFAESGYYVMRDGWSSKANYLLLDCGPHGSLRYGHAHADALSFELAAHGRTLLVDPGTYTYTGSAKWRDYFRSSGAHNTLTVDGESSSVPDGPFSWKHVARSRQLDWISRPRFDFFAGRHDGYERLASPLTHTRSVLFIKGDYWVIVDRVATEGTHRYELNFHFADGASPVIETEDGEAFARERPADAPGLEVFVGGAGGQWLTSEGWVSRCYGKRLAAPALTFALQGTGAREFVTFLFPRRAQEGKMRVRELRAKAGLAFEVVDGASRDLLLLGNGQKTEAIHFASDFQLTWIRLTKATSTLEELVLLKGRRASLGGQDIVDSSDFINYLSAHRSGKELRGETDRVADWHYSLGDWQEAGLQLLNQ